MNVVGMLATYVGITCLFWHFNFVAALTFFGVSIVALLTYGHAESKLQEENKNSPESKRYNV